MSMMRTYESTAIAGRPVSFDRYDDDKLIAECFTLTSQQGA